MRETDSSAKKRLRSRIGDAGDTIRDNLSHFSGGDNALDWRIDFAEVIADGGFDIALANPPYIHLRWQGDDMRKRYVAAGYKTYAKMGDIYQLFYERGCQLLRANDGLLAFITSNSWLRAQYGKSTRAFFAGQHRPLRWLDLGKDVFPSAIVDSGVLVLRTGGEAAAFPSVDMDSLATAEFPPTGGHYGQIRPQAGYPWSILSATEANVMEKMHVRGTTLADWQIQINLGIKTGLNDAFIIDSKTRQRLISEDPHSAEIIKRVIRGRHVARFRIQWSDEWLIDAHNGYSDVPAVGIESYPAIKVHLDGYLPAIAERHNQGITYYNLRSCKYYEALAEPKLLWLDLVRRGRFAYDDQGTFVESTAYFLTGQQLKYLCAVLNSTLLYWCLSHLAPTSGTGTNRWMKSYVEKLPVPLPDIHQSQSLVRIVDRILAAKDSDRAADISDHEAEIDRLVYDLYGLTDEETAAVEGRTSPTCA
ncbi:MAG: Eco57I restriction-modification methylase domain-containing protein [Chloroflexi bacterium]|nr:Eco57I restriction-modification methylase domain-containing protein [Chloroflexota bacterium]